MTREFQVVGGTRGRGFTLIELLVVMFILSLLAGLLLPSLFKADFFPDRFIRVIETEREKTIRCEQKFILFPRERYAFNRRSGVVIHFYRGSRKT